MLLVCSKFNAGMIKIIIPVECRWGPGHEWAPLPYIPTHVKMKQRALGSTQNINIVGDPKLFIMC